MKNLFAFVLALFLFSFLLAGSALAADGSAWTGSYRAYEPKSSFVKNLKVISKGDGSFNVTAELSLQVSKPASSLPNLQ